MSCQMQYTQVNKEETKYYLWEKEIRIEQQTIRERSGLDLFDRKQFILSNDCSTLI